MINNKMADAGSRTSKEVRLPRHRAWLEYIGTKSRLHVAHNNSLSTGEQLLAGKTAARERLFRATSSRAGSMREALMQTNLSNILKAGLTIAELAELLAALPCVPALQVLDTMRPAREWSQLACKAAAEAGHLEFCIGSSAKG